MIKLILFSSFAVVMLSGCVWYDDDWYDHHHRYSYDYDYDHRPPYGWDDGYPDYRPPHNHRPENRPPVHRPPEGRPPGQRPDYKQTRPLPH